MHVNRNDMLYENKYFPKQKLVKRVALFYIFVNLITLYLNRMIAGLSYLLVHSICYIMLFWLNCI